MRDLRSPFWGIRSPFGAGADAYAVLGYKPALVLDFDDEYYRANSAATTFSAALTHSATTNGTMVDSDGLLKWRPHNLALNSATPATQSITVVSGADYTVECTGVSIALSGAGTGTVTEGNPVTITASTTTLTLTVTGSNGTMWAYRSDLGGMVNNPDRGDSYVPTTSSAVYLPRRGHHVYNGTSWVNEGLLHESEARTNLITYSQDFTDASWGVSSVGVSVSPNDTISPDGNNNAAKITSTVATSYFGKNIISGTSAFTFRVKYINNQWVALNFGGGGTTAVWFDVQNGTVGTEASGYTGLISNVGGGWYECTIVGNNANNAAFIWPAVNGDGTVLGTSGKSCHIYGAQLEAGSVPSSYIPTSGGTVTRAAETLTIPAAKLPWPTPNVIGPELVTNGTFDTDTTGWTADATYGGTLTHDTTVFADGGLKITHTASYSGAYQAITTVVGKVYVVTASFDKDGATQTCTLEATTTATFNSGRLAAQEDGTNDTGSLSVAFVATGTTTYIHINGDSNAFRVHYWDNISVKEINPLAVSIQMQGRATGDTYTTTRWYLDANNYITQEINTSDFTFEQAASGTVDAVTGGSFTSGVNTPFNFASTHASTLVAAAVGGTALTDNTTPVALADLSSTDLQLGHSFMGTLKLMRVWPQNITEAGREGASA